MVARDRKWRKRYLAQLCWLGVGLSAMMGCEDAPLEEDRPIGKPVPDPPLPEGSWGLGACAGCVRQVCSDSLAECLADPECADRARCIEACPSAPGGAVDEACVATCPRGSSSSAERAAVALDACRSGDGATCAGCGGRPREGEVPPLDELHQNCAAPTGESNDCFACQDEHCCETIAACDADPECVAYKRCLRESAAEDPFNDCARTHPAGVALAVPNFLCGTYWCAIDTGGCEQADRDPCSDCIFGKCGLEWARVNQTVDGFLLSWCVAFCPVDDSGCDQACLDAYALSADVYLRLGECVLAQCDDAC